MSAPTRYNIDLLTQVRDQIANEELHDQGNWASIGREILNKIKSRWTDSGGDQYITVSCPTAACVAGWAASLSGAQMLVPAYQADNTSAYWRSRGTVTADAVLHQGQRVDISRFAQDALGLTEREAMALFDADWDNEQVLDNLDDILIAAKHGLDWKIRHVHGEDYDYDDDDDDSDGYFD